LKKEDEDEEAALGCHVVFLLAFLFIKSKLGSIITSQKDT
jgi:hypothetical protein